MDYGAAAPYHWFALPEAERENRAELTDDLCTIDGEQHFVRGCLEIPVKDFARPFVWGVWVSVSGASLQRILELWDATDVSREPPRTGWLCSWIRGYPEPKEVRCRIHLRSGSLRPRIMLQPSDYPLAIEQYDGITLERVKEIAALHGHS
jgi:hypothetical protein